MITDTHILTIGKREKTLAQNLVFVYRVEFLTGYKQVVPYSLILNFAWIHDMGLNELADKLI